MYQNKRNYIIEDDNTIVNWSEPPLLIHGKEEQICQ